MSRSFALRFISGKYQGGEFPLLPEREIVIGRSSELDMVLVEDMVSRKHAKISTHGGALVIMDLGSTNGTFVNGEKIKKTRIKEGDRILIGTSILKLVSVEKTDQIASTSQDEAKRNLAARGQKESGVQTTMSGTIDEVPVPDLLQLFSTSKRTGVLRINSNSGLGKIYLRDGNIFYSSINDDHDLGPMKALCRIVGWSNGMFEFGRPEDNQSFVLELEDSTEALLMEATRQLDEFHRLQAELPDASEPLSVPAPLDPPLSQLKPQELDVLQLVWNLGETGKVLDRSAATDYETASALLNLLSRGYVARG